MGSGEARFIDAPLELEQERMGIRLLQELLLDRRPPSHEHIEYLRHAPKRVGERVGIADVIEAAAAFGVPFVCPKDVSIVIAAGPNSVLENPIGKDTAKGQIQIIRDHLPFPGALAVAVEIIIFEITAIFVVHHLNRGDERVSAGHALPRLCSEYRRGIALQLPVRQCGCGA